MHMEKEVGNEVRIGKTEFPPGGVAIPSSGRLVRIMRTVIIGVGIGIGVGVEKGIGAGIGMAFGDEKRDVHRAVQWTVAITRVCRRRPPVRGRAGRRSAASRVRS